MSFMPEAADPGAYPPECTWVEEFSFLYRELYIVYDRIAPMAAYVRGVHPAYIPQFLATQGLLQVSAFPLGKLFSLSTNPSLSSHRPLPAGALGSVQATDP